MFEVTVHLAGDSRSAVGSALPDGPYVVDLESPELVGEFPDPAELAAEYPASWVACDPSPGMVRVAGLFTAQGRDFHDLDAHGARLPVGGSRLGELAELAGAAELLARQATARALRAVVAVVGQVRAEDAHAHGGGRSEAIGFAADEVGAALGISRRSAEIRMDDALALTTRLPLVLAALEAGLIGLPVAKAVISETTGCDAPTAAEVGARVLDRAGKGHHRGLGRLSPAGLALEVSLHPGLPFDLGATVTTGKARAWARDAVTDLAVEALRVKTPPRTAHPDVEVWPSPRPGLVYLTNEMTEATGIAILHRLDTDAHQLAQGPDEHRTLAELRSAVFQGRLLGHLDPDDTTPPARNGPDGPDAPGPVLPPAQPFTVEVSIHANARIYAGYPGRISEATLTDLVDQARRVAPASGSGFPAVRATTVDPAVCAGHHHGPDGKVLDPGPYQPGPKLKAAVRMLHHTCRYPGCTRPAQHCDLDHTVPYPRARPASATSNPSADTTTGSKPTATGRSATTATDTSPGTAAPAGTTTSGPTPHPKDHTTPDLAAPAAPPATRNPHVRQCVGLPAPQPLR